MLVAICNVMVTPLSPQHNKAMIANETVWNGSAPRKAPREFLYNHCCSSGETNGPVVSVPTASRLDWQPATRPEAWWLGQISDYSPKTPSALSLTWQRLPPSIWYVFVLNASQHFLSGAVYDIPFKAYLLWWFTSYRKWNVRFLWIWVEYLGLDVDNVLYLLAN